MKIATMELSFTRTIPATPEEVYDAWLDTESPGCPWHGSAKLIFEPRLDGLFYFRHISDKGEELPHFGRFAVLERGSKIQQTWMSRHTRGLESLVTVTLKKKGDDTLLTLVHANLPDDEFGKAHDGGWKHYLGIFEKRFAAK